MGLIVTDLYIFKGFYSSKIIIKPGHWEDDKNYSCELLIEKKTDNKYLFTFKNNSLIPKYILNYRNEEHFQNLPDTLFFNYLGRNLFPAYSFNYSNNFSCGTGLGLTSINPFEFHKIEVTYNDIIKDCSNIYTLKGTDFIYMKSKKQYLKLESNYREIDSLIKDENQLILATDSIQVEYYMNIYSFVSKNKMHTVSNRINVSIKDLLDQYKKQNSNKQDN